MPLNEGDIVAGVNTANALANTLGATTTTIHDPVFGILEAGGAGGLSGTLGSGFFSFNPILAVFSYLANKWDIFGLSPDMPSFDELPPDQQARALEQGYQDMMREQGANVDGQRDTEGVMQYSPEMMVDIYNNIKDTVGEYGLDTMGEIIDTLNANAFDNELLSPQQDLIDMGLTSGSDMFYDAVKQAEATKVDLTPEQLKDIQQRVYVDGEDAAAVLDEYGIFVDAATFDLKTGMDEGGNVLDRVNILEASDAGGGGGGGGGATDGAGGGDAGAGGGGGTGGEGSVGSDAQVGDWVYREEDGMFYQVGGNERFIPVDGTYTDGQILTNDTAGDVFGEWGTMQDGTGAGIGGGVSGEVDNGGEWIFTHGVFVNSQTGIVRQPDYSVFDATQFEEGNSYSIGPNGELVDLGDGSGDNGDNTGDDNSGDDGLGDDGTGDDGTGDDGTGDGTDGDGTGTDGVGDGNNGTGNGNNGNGWQANAFNGLFQQAMLDAAKTGLYLNVPGQLGSQWRRG